MRTAVCTVMCSDPMIFAPASTVSVELSKKPTEAEVLEAFSGFRSVPQERKLPSAPANPVIYMEDKDRPQPRRDAGRARGMAVFVGRLRPCPVFAYKFIALGHNRSEERRVGKEG